MINKNLWHEALLEFNNEQFFECHETLEEYWLSEDDPEYKNLIQGIIHVAVAFYHWRNENFIGYRKQLEKGLKKLAVVSLDDYGRMLGADLAEFYQNMRAMENPDHFPKIKITG